MWFKKFKIDFSLYAGQDVMALGGGAYTTAEVVLQIHICPALPKKLHTHTHHMTESNVTHWESSLLGAINS